RKNVQALLDFYRNNAPESISKQYDLRLAGQHGWGEPSPDELHDPDRGIIWEGRVSDRRLKQLYQNASLLVLPSLGEGFGMPILEAFRHRLPVVLSPLDVFREVAGKAAWYLPGFESSTDWVEVFQEALNDPARRRLKTTIGLRRSRQFCWADSANRYLSDVRRHG
ncbi:MAG: glycosyltransferase, partial [bacterium]